MGMTRLKQESIGSSSSSCYYLYWSLQQTLGSLDQKGRTEEVSQHLMGI